MRIRTLESLAIVSALVMWASPVAHAADPNIACGATIIQSVTLTGDLNCAGVAFYVRPEVTPIVVDLSGFTVSSSTTAIDLGLSRTVPVVLKNGRILGGTGEQSGLTTYANLIYDGAGLGVGPESKATILDSQFLHGAAIRASQAFLDVQRSQFSSSGTGTAIRAFVSGVTAIGNSITGYATGIEFSSGCCASDKANIQNNTISGNQIGILGGFWYPNGGTISGNQISGNSSDGIQLLDGTGSVLGLVVNNNTASSNGGDGIHVIAGAQVGSPPTPRGIHVTLTGNTASGNRGYGIESPGSIPPNVSVIDGGGNVADFNQGPAQCLNVACQTTASAPTTTTTTTTTAPATTTTPTMTSLATTTMTMAPPTTTTTVPTRVLGDTLVRGGYWMVSGDGRVFPFGAALPLGQPAGTPGAANAVDIEHTPTGMGYWIVDNGGHVYPYGDAVSFGGISSQLSPSDRVTSLSGTPTGRGYWVFTSAGRVIPFGDATFFGDMSAVTLNGPVRGSVATPTGKGYYMVASDGGVFTFGDAKFHGSAGAMHLNQPVMGMAPRPDESGYWLVASDGGIFAFDVPFYGSTGNLKLNKPIATIVPNQSGYLMVAQDGGIFAFGNVAFHGSLGANPPSSPVVSVALLP